MALLLIDPIGGKQEQMRRLVGAFGWSALAVLSLRPAIFELLAWGLYGDRLTVIPFQS